MLHRSKNLGALTGNERKGLSYPDPAAQLPTHPLGGCAFQLVSEAVFPRQKDGSVQCRRSGSSAGENWEHREALSARGSLPCRDFSLEPAWRPSGLKENSSGTQRLGSVTALRLEGLGKGVLGSVWAGASLGSPPAPSSESLGNRGSERLHSKDPRQLGAQLERDCQLKQPFFLFLRILIDTFGNLH